MSSYIDSINQASTAATGTSNITSAEDVIMGKEDFLQLLVAQLQNQDPLNPAEPTEFTAQLAQFSSLEQLTNLNDSMDSLVSATNNSDRLATLSTIGKDATYESNSFQYSGGPVALGYKLADPAANVTLLLQNQGVTVATIAGKELGAGNHYINWDGLSTAGIPAASGDYSIVVQAKSAEGASVQASSLIRSEVTGVDLGGDKGTTLITKAGEVAFNSILGVFEPGTILQESSEEPQPGQEISENTSDTVEEVTDEVASG